MVQPAQHGDKAPPYTHEPMQRVPVQVTSQASASVPSTRSDWSRFARRIFGRHTAYNRLARHLDLLLRYGRPRKLLNIARAEIARLRGNIEVASFPFNYTIDIGNVCNLRCPLCPTGTNDLQRPQGFMRLAEFETILEKIKPYAIEVVMHNWGEPFLNPEFVEIVRAAKREGIGTAVSSNLNLVHRGQDYLHRVVDYGLDNLVVSIDGVTQDVYHHYRRGGDLAHVLDNLREMVRYKRSIGSATPALEWQFIVMKHNEHQIDEVRRMAAEIGVDRVRFTSAERFVGEVVKRHAGAGEPHSIDADLSGHALHLVHLVLVVLHDDELPLDGRRRAADGALVAHHFAQVVEDVREVPATTVMVVHVLRHAVDGHHQVV